MLNQFDDFSSSSIPLTTVYCGSCDSPFVTMQMLYYIGIFGFCSIRNSNSSKKFSRQINAIASMDVIRQSSKSNSIRVECSPWCVDETLFYLKTSPSLPSSRNYSSTWSKWIDLIFFLECLPQSFRFSSGNKLECVVIGI